MSNQQSTLCILRDEKDATWSVWMCSGVGERQRLESFPDRAGAVDFAAAEAARHNAEPGGIQLHLPDDCPCYPEFIRLRDEKLREKK